MVGPNAADITGEGAREDVVSERHHCGEPGKETAQERERSCHECENWVFVEEGKWL